MNQTTNRIYVVGGNLNVDQASVIDGTTDLVVDTIPVGKNPSGVGVNASTNRVYVSNSLDGTVSVIDGGTDKVVATVRVGSGPTGIGLSPTDQPRLCRKYQRRDGVSYRRDGEHACCDSVGWNKPVRLRCATLQCRSEPDD